MTAFVLPELHGRGLRVCGGGLLVGQRLPELRFAGLRDCCSVTSPCAISWFAATVSAARLSCSGGAGLGAAPPAGTAVDLARLFGRHRGDRLGDGLRLVRRRVRRLLDVLGLAVLIPLLTRPATSALTSPGLPGLLVLVGLLERLRGLRLDRGLHRGDERLLVERARPAGRPSCRPWRPSPARPGRRPEPALRPAPPSPSPTAAGCARFAAAAPLTAPRDLAERRVGGRAGRRAVAPAGPATGPT